MFVDQKTEACLIPLNEEIDASKGRLELANSQSSPPDQATAQKADSVGSLSEMAVLGKSPP